ncbi:MAG: YceI family protein [Salinivirgaceae bacterium]|jgi:polyisoprenoid-binding protein YceI|nr:YceI family protein [Salinivirgaceae bacterium]
MKTRKITAVVLAILVSGIVSAQSFTVNAEKSTLKWTGKKVGGEHSGTIQIKEGNFEVKKDKIESGSFTISMTTISNSDLEDAGYNAKLVGHLKSDDFFGVEKFPTAVLKITEASVFKDGKAKVKADLTIKGKTNPVEFDVMKAGNSFTSTITVDRSKYDVKYGSSSFFEGLGDKVIYDEFTLEVKLVTK